MIRSRVKSYLKRIFLKEVNQEKPIDKILLYKSKGSIPWSEGYNEYKWQSINAAISNTDFLNNVAKKILPQQFGQYLDERIVEYSWIFSRKLSWRGKFLDAGSTFNFESIISHKFLAHSQSYIYTYYPEQNNFSRRRISYIYGDLRYLPFRESFFDTVVCQSTLEHIDMDNSMYGYELSNNQAKGKSYEYLTVVEELVRVTRSAGTILLTFPFGKFENHGFFQQFDSEMVDRMLSLISRKCNVSETYFKYLQTGWIFSNRQECCFAESYNPHTGIGKGNDNAAHSRAICCLEITKN